MRLKPFQPLIILSLAVLVLFNGTGLFLTAYVQTGIHRMGNSLHKMEEHAETICMSNSEFRNIAWIGKRDFIWNGHVYDMISLEQTGDKVNIRCASDKKEDSIRKNLASNFHSQGKNLPASKSGNIAFKFFPLVAFAQKTELSGQSVSSLILFDLHDPAATQSSAVSLNSPPPENA